MSFSTQIISNHKYRKYNKIRGVFFVLFLVIFTPIYFRGSSPSRNLNFIEEMKEHPAILYYYITLIVLAIIYWTIHYFVLRFKKIGTLEISEESIHIILKNNSEEIMLGDIDKLWIERGTTFHKEDHQLEKPYKGDNFIEIHAIDGTQNKFEFTIQSAEHNEEFDHLIRNLKMRLKSRLKFTSI